MGRIAALHRQVQLLHPLGLYLRRPTEDPAVGSVRYETVLSLLPSVRLVSHAGDAIVEAF